MLMEVVEILMEVVETLMEVVEVEVVEAEIVVIENVVKEVATIELQFEFAVLSVCVIQWGSSGHSPSLAK